MFKKKSKKIDHGLTLPYKCSNCCSFGLHLKEDSHKSTGNPLVDIAVNIWGKNKALWVFECPSCLLATDIPEVEIDEVIKLNQKAKEYSSGTLGENEFMDILSTTTSSIVQEVYNRSNSWECEKCKNDIPPTFEVCWNCGAECPSPEKLIDIKGSIQLNSFALLGSSYEFKREEEEE